MKQKILKAGLLILGLGAAFNTSALIIDDFDTGVFDMDADFSMEVSGLNPSNTIGGKRTISAAVTAISGIQPTQLANSIMDGDLTVKINHRNLGRYEHSQDASVKGTSMIEWDLGVGGVDLTEGDTQHVVRVAFDEINFNPGLLVLFIGDTSANSQSVTQPINNGLTFVDFLFTDFPSVDLEHVSTISLTIDGQGVSGLDVAIDSVRTTVPEPSALILMGIGLFGFCVSKKTPGRLHIAST